MLVAERQALLEVLLEFKPNYTQQGINDVLTLIHAEDVIKFSDTDYLVKLDPLEYSLLQTLQTVHYTLMSKPLDYGH